MPATSAMASPAPARPASMRRYSGAKLPIPILAEAARGLGFIDPFPDSDGTLRRLPLLVQMHDVLLPQLATAVARDVLGAQGDLAADREAMYFRPRASTSGVLRRAHGRDTA
jgi:adenylate cyclase